MAIETHYSVLGINRSASTGEIEAAYRTILLANRTDKTQHLAPFARVLAERRLRAAHAAYEVLVDPEKAAKYDDEVGIWSSFVTSQTWRRPWESTSSGAPEPEHAFPHRPTNTKSSDDDEEYTSAPPSSTNETPGQHSHAEYRYGLTRTATDIDIKLKGWSLYLLLSTKFRFLNTVTALPTGSDTRTVAFKIHLERKKSHRPIGTDSFTRMNPEVIIGVEYSPIGRRSVGNVQTVFKEVRKDSLTLTIYIASTPSDKDPSATPPWSFGLDFDMNSHPAAWRRRRGMCMIFTRDRLSVEETPEDVLKREDSLMVDAFCGLGDEKLMGLEYKGVRPLAKLGSFYFSNWRLEPDVSIFNLAQLDLTYETKRSRTVHVHWYG